MSAHGLRDVGYGKEEIRNPEVAAELRRRGQTLNRLSVVSALAATALAALGDHAGGSLLSN